MPDSVAPFDPGPFDLARIGAGLPFATAAGDLRAALDGAPGVAVVEAPPGTGKTTVAPPVVANLIHATSGGGRVVVTGPRRVAVRAAARRLAELSGNALGDRVGYSVRGESRTSSRTLIEFVTPGLLVRRLLADPALDGVAAVVLDEVHERSLDSDLLVGMLAEVRILRDDLRLVAMSATLDAAAFAAVLGGEHPAPLVDCPSALHPLEVRWAPPPGPRLDERGVSRDFLRHVSRTAAAAHQEALLEDATVDALVFLPGASEVGFVAQELRSIAPPSEILELHGRVDAAEQDRAVTGRGVGEPPRIVVSTGLAESSLTVPGVRLVVDSGLTREPRRDSARDMSGLVTVAASRASAAQRAGRAARLGPGVVVRCYDERTYARMPEHITPEMATADLTGAALTLAAWGTPRGDGMALPSPPPVGAMRDAERTLLRLGAVAEDGSVTEAGRGIAAVPADPRLARALLIGAATVGARPAAEVVATLADDHRSATADLPAVLRGLRAGGPASARWRREVTRFERLAGNPQPVSTPASAGVESGYVTALAFPQRVARRIGGPGEPTVYLMASGSRAALPSSSPLAHHEWIAVADVARSEGRATAGTGAVIRLAAPLTRDAAEDAAASLLVDEVRVEWDGRRVIARRVQALGAIEFSSTPTKPTGADAQRAVRTALERHGLAMLSWPEEADALRRRLAFLHRHVGMPWPAVDEEALLERLEEWLGPEMDALGRGAAVGSLDLASAVSRLLPWPEAARLDELAPKRLVAPSGSRVRVDYPAVDEDAPPVVAVKLQECFGLAETPRLADGRAPVLFHLLSPAGRPLAITDDLASFWAGPYAGVRSDMRGRYPKHPWPEDPWNHGSKGRPWA